MIPEAITRLVQQFRVTCQATGAFNNPQYVAEKEALLLRAIAAYGASQREEALRQAEDVAWNHEPIRGGPHGCSDTGTPEAIRALRRSQ